MSAQTLFREQWENDIGGSECPERCGMNEDLEPAIRMRDPVYKNQIGTCVPRNDKK